MKKTIKAIVALALVAVLAVSFAGCAKMNYVMNGTIKAINEVKTDEWLNTDTEATDADGDEDAPVIDAFATGTYGGVEFATQDDVVNYYVEAYNNTKAKTAQYKNAEGATETFYAFLGDDDLKVENILVDGKANATIENLVPGVVGGLFSKNINGLPPAKNRNPEKDVDEVNQETLQTSRLVPEDVLAANVVDNGDGTITLTIQPKAFNMSVPGMDCQGHMFSTLGDIGPTVASISILSWASGDTEENCRVEYKGGTAIIKIDTASKEIVEADYHEVAIVKVQHANVAIIRDKSAQLTVKYDQHFPCTDDYMKETKGVTRA